MYGIALACQTFQRVGDSWFCICDSPITTNSCCPWQGIGQIFTETFRSSLHTEVVVVGLSESYVFRIFFKVAVWRVAEDILVQYKQLEEIMKSEKKMNLN